jgi:hypothetical protein
MAKIKLADACRRLSLKYEVPVTYQQGYMFAVANIIPAERDETGRFWLIDEANLTTMAKAFGLVAAKKAKSTAKSTAKPKPAAKPALTRPARSRATRPAA